MAEPCRSSHRPLTYFIESACCGGSPKGGSEAPTGYRGAALMGTGGTAYGHHDEGTVLELFSGERVPVGAAVILTGHEGTGRAQPTGRRTICRTTLAREKRSGSEVGEKGRRPSPTSRERSISPDVRCLRVGLRQSDATRL